MELPPGYLPSDSKGKVCKLKKSLYGLKQAGRQWYRKLSAAFNTMGFKKSAVDHAVFYEWSNEETTIICVSTDDLTIAASSLHCMDIAKQLLRNHFQMTNLGKLEWMLGIKLTQDRKQHIGTLTQTAYIDHIVDKFYLSDAKLTKVPLTSGTKLSKNQSSTSPKDQEKMQHIPY
jgi:hypothetical protein